MKERECIEGFVMHICSSVLDWVWRVIRAETLSKVNREYIFFGINYSMTRLIISDEPGDGVFFFYIMMTVYNSFDSGVEWFVSIDFDRILVFRLVSKLCDQISCYWQMVHVVWEN